MANHWAEENLKVIRTLMERAAMYRRELAPTMLIAGGMGVIASAVGHFVINDSEKRFTWYWLAVAVVTLAAVFITVRRQALRDKEPVWSPPARRVAQLFLVPLSVGAFVPIFINFDFFLSPAIWLIFLGIGYYSAGFFMQRGIKLFGVGVIFVGCVFPFLAPAISRSSESIIIDPQFCNIAMGIMFGGCHLAYGVYLYFTEKRNNEA